MVQVFCILGEQQTEIIQEVSRSKTMPGQRAALAGLFLAIIIVIVVCLVVLSCFPGMKLVHNRKRDPQKSKFNWKCHIEHPMLEPDRVEKILEKLASFKTTDSNSVLSRVGTASYLSRDPMSYFDESKISNAAMRPVFAEEYELLRKRLEQITQRRCVYPDLGNGHELALPGFHIFKGGSWLGTGWNVASVHVDLQYEKVQWPCKDDLDFTKTFSFTLALRLPERCGLQMFDREHDPKKPLRTAKWWSMRNDLVHKIYYKPGNLYVHSGHQYHMVLGWKGSAETHRVTMQGHAVYNKTKDEYWLYW